MAKDPKNKLHAKAVEMVEVMKDPKALAKRVEMLSERLDKERAKDLACAKLIGKVAPHDDALRE